MPPTPANSCLSRRCVLGVGVCAASAILYSSNSGLPAPFRASLASRASTSAGTTHGMDASPTAAPLPPPPAPVKAVNLRDIGEVDPRLRRGVLYRCSQIYTPEVLKELRIKTVVDLRGRAERGARSKSSSSKSGASKVDDSVVGPPPLLNPEQVSALGAAKGDQIQGQPQASSSPDQAASAAAGGDGEPSAGGMQAAADPQLDFAVTRLKRQGSAASMSEGSMSEEEGGSNGNGGVRRRGDTEEMAAALGSQADWQGHETEKFNVIPTRQFGYAMLRMPSRVWRGAFGNLFSGKDPRKPFVDAFADEQLLGFFKYYKIILEHSKSNIAAVMRVFAKDSSYPTLVHCAHGKDRTGVIIMLLLLVCDAPHEAIVQDYVQSEIQLRKYRESLGLADPTGATGAVIPLNEVIIASTQETLRALLAYMDSTYITVDNYLASCGLSPQEVAAIRRNLMRPDAVTADGQVKAAAAAAAQAPAGSTQA